MLFIIVFIFSLSTILYYDAHTHLNDDKLFPNRESYVQAFIDAGGKGLVTVGVDNERNTRAIHIASQAQQEFPDFRLKATIGYHPSEVCFHKIQNSNDVEQAIQSLANLYAEHSQHIVAIGEGGIDTHYDGDACIDIQKSLFAQQCDLAQELDLPIVIHSRDDFHTTRDVIKNYKQQKIYFHCRGYGPEELKQLQDYFPQFRLGFCGNLTYPKAQKLRDSLAIARMDSVVFETDAPYLAPQNFRGKLNQPAYVSDIYTYAAQLQPQLSPAQVEQNITKLFMI